MPETLWLRLIPETSAALAQPVPPAQQWCQRRVRVCDGTTVRMRDTVANQAVDPPHGNQATGCGFPIAKLVVIFSWVTGAVVSAWIGDWHTREIVLSRQRYADRDPDEVLVADQADGRYMDLALVQQPQADAVLRKHHARHTDLRRGRKSGIGDHQVVWQNPKKCPEQMTPDEFAAVPTPLRVREVGLRLSRRGWRDEWIIVVTTLLDAKRDSATQLTQRDGWRGAAAEVNLRHLKTTLKLEMLTAKTPEMGRQDLWPHLLAYNL